MTTPIQTRLVLDVNKLTAADCEDLRRLLMKAGVRASEHVIVILVERATTTRAPS